MTLISYSAFDIHNLKVNDMLKISFTYTNAFRHSIKEYIGSITEHIWTQLLEILPNNQLLVMVSNNCYFSKSSLIKPLQYTDNIIINISHIKEKKTVNLDLYKQQSEKLLKHLPSHIKLILASLPKDNAIKFLEAYAINQNQLQYL